MTTFGPETRRPRQPSKSRIVGVALLPNGTRTTAYRAVVEAMCGACARPILPDALFSRGTQQRHTTGNFGVGLTKAPICVACRPLRVEGEGAANASAPTEEPTEEKHYER